MNPESPYEQMVMVKYYKGPMDGQILPVPVNAVGMGSAMPIGDRLAVYEPKTKNGETAFVFSGWVKDQTPPNYSVFHPK